MNLEELPGAELILPGIDDLRNGNSYTVGALLIAICRRRQHFAIAATRLSKAGLDFPRDCLAKEPELTLYVRLQEERDDAYPYYNALLRNLNSFCNALELSYKYRAK